MPIPPDHASFSPFRTLEDLVEYAKSNPGAVTAILINTPGTLAAIAKGNGRVRPEVTRFKGLGEMMPKVLWETTLDPRTRRLLRVEVADQIRTDRVITDLMGRDASARFRFIMERADEALDLDV